MSLNERKLNQENEALSKLITLAERDLRQAPEGKLRVTNSGQKVKYYHLLPGKGANGVYLRNEDRLLAEELAQKEYAQKFWALAVKRRNFITSILKKLSALDLTKPFNSMSPKKQVLVTPYVWSQEEKIRQWESVEYESPPIPDDIPEIYTNRGERVRSKSEKIIADRLYELGIPYRYESPLYLDYTLLHPDFTILDTRTFEEVYLEHLGMMDNEEYLNKALKRLDLLAQYGIMTGHRLLLTFETAKHPVNPRYLDSLLKDLIPETDNRPRNKLSNR